MKALRWHAARDLRLSELERQAPRPGEVELEVAYCGICGSDLHEYQSGPHSIPQAEAHPLSGCRAPLTLGHEFCGVVAALGPGVEGLRIGDRVAVEPEYRCGECRYCREGRYNLCESMGFIGLMGDGGFAERARVPAYMLHRLPDAVGFRQAAVLEPAAVALHALRRSSLAPGQRCAVFGLGPIGLLLVMLARQRGIEDIVAIDVSPERLALAGERGVPVAVASGDDVFIKETKPLLPHTTFVETKQAEGQNAGTSLSPEQSYVAIYAAVKATVRRGPFTMPQRLQAPVVCRLQTHTPALADHFCQWPALERV
ncbi:alcohol dehydrogenase catalytic domain-containing protein, partial [Pseudomonas aeruginosa]|nr:alcohol dehydrogenase catalytic domain-containing protein [Pseudomonas aeruginosa]